VSAALYRTKFSNGGFMKKVLLVMSFMLSANFANAATSCGGKISAVYKCHFMKTLSVMIKDDKGISSPWINLPTKSDESMALMAFAADFPVSFYFASADVTSCGEGAWSHNTVLEGYFIVPKG
jgi:hypothetical protein